MFLIFLLNLNMQNKILNRISQCHETQVHMHIYKSLILLCDEKTRSPQPYFLLLLPPSTYIIYRLVQTKHVNYRQTYFILFFTTQNISFCSQDTVTTITIKHRHGMMPVHRGVFSLNLFSTRFIIFTCVYYRKLFT